MTTPTLTDSDRALLEQAAGYRYAGLDLRFEGGPYIAELDRLVARGLLDFSTGSTEYMVTYLPTDLGREALAS